MFFPSFSEFVQEQDSNCASFESKCKVNFDGKGKKRRKITINHGGTSNFPSSIFDGFLARKIAKEA